MIVYKRDFCYLFAMQKNEADQDDMNGISNTGIMKNPSNLRIIFTTAQYTDTHIS